MSSKLIEDVARQGARDERDRRIRFAVFAGLASRGLSMAISLVSLPLSLTILDKDRYGVWVTVGSLIAWLSVADIGLGNSLVTPLAAAASEKDHTREREIVSTPFFCIVVISLALGAVLAVVVPFVPWGAVLGAPQTIPNNELVTIVALASGLFLLSLPLGMVDRVLAALQESHKATIWSILSNVLSCAALGVVAVFHWGIVGLIVATSGLGVVLRIGIWAQLVRSRPWMLPRVSAVSWLRARTTLRSGVSFLAVQMLGIAVFQTDNIVVAQLFGSGAVTEYAVSFRLALVLTGLAGLYMAPLWPAYADALSRGDLHWFEQTLRRAVLKFVGGAAVVGIAVAVLGVWVVRLWTRGAVEPSSTLLIVIGIYIPIHVGCQVTAAALNALGRLRSQVIYSAIAAVVNLVLSIVLGRAMGLAGVCLATCIAGLLPGVATALELRVVLKSGQLSVRA